MYSTCNMGCACLLVEQVFVCVCVCVLLAMFRIAYYHNSHNTLVRCSVYSYFAKFLCVKQKYCMIL